jgi:trimethylamine--corrinoid protein Co-methyltransferase
MRLAALQVLSEEEIRAIHQASLDILDGCGVKVLSPRMLQALEAKGLRVDSERQLAFFSRATIEEALSRVPRRLEVFDREGRHLYTLGDGRPRIAAGHNAVNWVDTQSGQTRFSRVADVELFARLCEHLEHIDMIGIPVMPQDVPDPRATLLHGVRAVIRNSRKPLYFSTDNRTVNRAVIEMCRAAFRGDLKEQVYGISQLSSTSPLYWEQGVLEAILDTLDTGVPIALLPEPIAGVSAPYSLAGLLTVHNSECLSGLAMIQLLRPETRVLYGSSWTTSNMLTGAALVGSVETSLCRIAGTQLARHYGVPSHTTAPNSDNHAHDEQNAWEKTFSSLAAVGAGTDLIVNCGMFATGMTCSHEQLLMDEEISACCLRLAEGLEVSPETVAEELIRERGPQGETYLTAEHTLRRLRFGEYLKPRLSVSGPLATWQEHGARDTYALARERVREAAGWGGAGGPAAGTAALQAPPLEEARLRALNEIIAGFRHDG